MYKSFKFGNSKYLEFQASCFWLRPALLFEVYVDIPGAIDHWGGGIHLQLVFLYLHVEWYDDKHVD